MFAVFASKFSILTGSFRGGSRWLVGWPRYSRQDRWVLGGRPVPTYPAKHTPNTSVISHQFWGMFEGVYWYFLMHTWGWQMPYVTEWMRMVFQVTSGICNKLQSLRLGTNWELCFQSWKIDPRLGDGKAIHSSSKGLHFPTLLIVGWTQGKKL